MDFQQEPIFKENILKVFSTIASTSMNEHLSAITITKNIFISF